MVMMMRVSDTSLLAYATRLHITHIQQPAHHAWRVAVCCFAVSQPSGSSAVSHQLLLPMAVHACRRASSSGRQGRTRQQQGCWGWGRPLGRP
jgi:hypothetical protein